MLAYIKNQLRTIILIKLRCYKLYQLLLKLEHTIFGRKIRLETSSVCQLACPSCPTAKGETKTGAVGWGRLTADNFKRFVDQNTNIRNIEISNWGEIFLNSDLVKILEYAHKHNIRLQAINGVHLNKAQDEMLEALVKYNFRLMSVSLDGASNDSYSIYRINGNLDNVLKNIDRINYYKKKYNKKYPKMIWQFVVFGHNEHEIELAKQMAEERDMIFNPIANLDPQYSPVKNPQSLAQKYGISFEPDQDKMLDGISNRFDMCNQMWEAPQINWDGKLLGCCLNNWGDYGNVFEQGLSNALKNESYIYAKKMLIGLEPKREDIPCASCQVYLSMLN